MFYIPSIFFKTTYEIQISDFRARPLLHILQGANIKEKILLLTFPLIYEVQFSSLMLDNSKLVHLLLMLEPQPWSNTKTDLCTYYFTHSYATNSLPHQQPQINGLLFRSLYFWVTVSISQHELITRTFIWLIIITNIHLTAHDRILIYLYTLHGLLDMRRDHDKHTSCTRMLSCSFICTLHAKD